jgi:hypothetical protein
MAIDRLFTKSALFLPLALCTPAFAATVQSPTCEIRGDPDIYGIGIRCSFYLQWASLVIILLFCPKESSSLRTASTITTLAVYINTFRSMHEGSLVAFDYPLLWYLCNSLTLWNWPTTEAEYKKHGGSQAMVLLIMIMYYLAGPWVFFKGLQYGRQPGCDVKYFIFVPISIYSKGLSTFMKVSSIMGVALAAVTLFFVVSMVGVWSQSWRKASKEEEEEEDKDVEKAGRDLSRFMAILQLITGSFAIGFAEKTLQANHVTFPGTHYTDSGQLMPLLIGIFTFAASVINALRASMR